MKKSLVLGVALGALTLGAWVSLQFKADFQTLDGEAVRWQSLEGQWVVVNYFAEWCAPCLREVPELNDFAAHARDHSDIALFGVSYDPLAPDQLQRLKDKYQMAFDLIKPTDPTPNLITPKPQQLPATYVVSPEGKVVKTLLGEQTAAGLIQTLEGLQSL